MRFLKALEEFVRNSMMTPLSCVETRGKSNERGLDLMVPLVSKLWGVEAVEFVEDLKTDARRR